MPPETPKHEAQMEDVKKRIEHLDTSDGEIDGNIAKSKDAVHKVHELMDRVKTELKNKNEDVRKGWEEAVKILFNGLNELKHSEKWNNVQAYQKQIDLFIHNLESVVGKTPNEKLETKAQDLDTHEYDLALYSDELLASEDLSPGRKEFIEKTLSMQRDTEMRLEADRVKLEELKRKNPDAQITDVISNGSDTDVGTRMQLQVERNFYAKNVDQWKNVTPGDTVGEKLKELTQSRLLFVESLIGGQRSNDLYRPDALAAKSEKGSIEYQKVQPEAKRLLELFSFNTSLPGESITVTTVCDEFNKALENMKLQPGEEAAGIESLTKELKQYNFGPTEKSLRYLRIMAAGKEPMLYVGAPPGEIVRLKYDNDLGQVTFSPLGKPTESLSSQKQRRELQTATTEQAKQHVEETKQQKAIVEQERDAAKAELAKVEEAHGITKEETPAPAEPAAPIASVKEGSAGGPTNSGDGNALESLDPRTIENSLKDAPRMIPKEVLKAREEAERQELRVQELEAQEKRETRRADQSKHLEYTNLFGTKVDDSDSKNSPAESSARNARMAELEEELFTGVNSAEREKMLEGTIPPQEEIQEVEIKYCKRVPGMCLWELERFKTVVGVTAEYRGGKWYLGMEVGGRTQFFSPTEKLQSYFDRPEEEPAIENPALKRAVVGINRYKQDADHVFDLIKSLKAFNAR